MLVGTLITKALSLQFEGEGLEVRLERMEDAVKSMKLMGHISDAKLLSATRFNTNFFIEAFVKVRT